MIRLLRLAYFEATYRAYRVGLRRYCWQHDQIVGPLHYRRRCHTPCMTSVAEVARRLGRDPAELERDIAAGVRAEQTK